MRPAPVALWVVAFGLVLFGVGCGDDGGGATNQEAAEGACSVLVTWTNDVTEIVNTTEGEMQEGADLRGLMLDAVDEVIVRTEVLGEELGQLEFPDSEGGRALADDLVTGQQAAADDLAGFREEILAIPDPDPERVNYRKAQLVVELEKPRSLVKPDVQNDLGDEDLEATIAAEDACDFVTRSQ